MHEFAIAETLVRELLTVLQDHGGTGQLKTTRVVVGALRQIVPENIQFAYEVLTRDTAAAGSILELEIIPLEVRCRACQWCGGLAGEPGHIIFICPACNSCDLEVCHGKELYLKNLELQPGQAGRGSCADQPADQPAPGKKPTRAAAGRANPKAANTGA